MLASAKEGFVAMSTCTCFVERHLHHPRIIPHSPFPNHQGIKKFKEIRIDQIRKPKKFEVIPLDYIATGLPTEQGHLARCARIIVGKERGVEASVTVNSSWRLGVSSGFWVKMHARMSSHS